MSARVTSDRLGRGIIRRFRGRIYSLESEVGGGWGGGGGGVDSRALVVQWPPLVEADLYCHWRCRVAFATRF